MAAAISPRRPLFIRGSEMNLVERIDHWGRVSPDATAHVSDERTLTYGELCRRSDALAAHLAERFGDDRAQLVPSQCSAIANRKCQSPS